MRSLTPLIGVLSVLFVWWLVTATGLCRPLFLPRPEVVVGRCFSLLATGGLLADVLATLLRLALGLAMGIVIGVSLGLLMGTSERIYAALEVVVDFFRSLPVAAMFPLFLLAFGTSDVCKIATAAYSTSLIIMVNTVYGVRSGSRLRRRLAASLGASPWQIFLKVTLPDALPQIAAGVRTAVSLGLIVVIVTEMFVGTRVGLGQRIYEWSLLYRVPEMYSAILVAGLLGYGVNKLFVLTEARLVHWRGRA
jgi:NitT/TauT family transport system permease protein